MRILIISDIHANLTALDAVLTHAAGAWEILWCLGDVVGYGPDPNECVARLQSYPHTSLSGNHDWAVLGRLDITTFNDEARTAIEWTQKMLTPEAQAYLEPLPSRIDLPLFTLAHASPRQPVWEYIADLQTAEENFAHFDTPFCLVGHTHFPAVFHQLPPTRRVVGYYADYAHPVLLTPEMRLILNPGSVGQPRDNDPRAAYAILDTEAMTWQHHRVVYDVQVTQQRMRRHRLPTRLIKRLEQGW